MIPAAEHARSVLFGPLKYYPKDDRCDLCHTRKGRVCIGLNRICKKCMTGQWRITQEEMQECDRFCHELMAFKHRRKKKR